MHLSSRVSGLVLLATGFASALAAATWTVTTCDDVENDDCSTGECTLREAIADANPAGGDTIDFDPSIACVDGEIDLVGSGLTIGKDLTILGPGASALAVDGQGSVRVLDVTAGTVVIEDLTIRGGTTSGSGEHGAGLRNGGDLTLRRVVITDNHAFGGATSFADGAQGGGIHNRSTGILTLEDSFVSGNTAGDGGTFDGTNYLAGDAGGILTYGNLILTGTTVSGNTSGTSFSPLRTGGRGGAIYFGAGTGWIEGSTISGNRTGEGCCPFSMGQSPDGAGGGLFVRGNSVVVLVNSTISGNQTGTGTNGKPGDGGGIYALENASVQLGNVTIAANTAGGEGGGIYRASPAMVQLSNTIVAGNTAGSASTVDCSGLSSGSDGYNLVGVADGCPAFGVTGDQTGSGASPLDPLLSPLADNGGPTQTHLPSGTSPVLDAGDPAGCSYYDPLLAMDVDVTEDQRGIARPLDRDYDGTPTCDVGSVEVEPETFTVTVTLDGSGSVTSSPGNIDCGSTCADDFEGGTTVQLTATGDAGNVFSGWSGSCTGMVNPCELLVDEAESVTAAFVPAHDLTVIVTGTGSGSVTGTGIDCPGDCAEPFAEGTEVTLTAAEDAGSAFSGWSGDCSGTGSCVVTMSADMEVTATFTDLVEVSVALQGNGSGVVAGSPGAIDCGVTCADEFLPGTPVDLTATPALGSVFVAWGGACSGTGICHLMPVSDTAVTARFEPVLIFADGLETGTTPWALVVP